MDNAIARTAILATVPLMHNVAEAEATASALAGPQPPLVLGATDLLGLPLAAATATALAVLGWDLITIVPLAAAAAVAPALARIDVTERRLPNLLTLPLLLIALLACIARVLSGDLAVLVALGCGAVLLLMAVAGGMGMGDVKLGTALALATATLGWAVPLAGLAASVIVGGIAGLIALIAGHRTVAFGPWLIVGSLLAAGVAALHLV